MKVFVLIIAALCLSFQLRAEKKRVLVYEYGSFDGRSGLVYDDITYSYDDNGNCVLIVWKYENGDEGKVEITYDENGNRTLMVGYYKDDGSDEWIINRKIEFTYDDNGHTASAICYDWDGENNKWIICCKLLHTYDENGCMTLFEYWELNSDNSLYLYGSHERTYNQDGNLVFKRVAERNNKEEYTYDENGRETVWVESGWDIENNKWIDSTRVVRSWDKKGNLTMEAYYLWDKDENIWVGDGTKKEYAYDENGSQTLYVRYIWDSRDNKWVNREKEEWTYNEKGDETLYVSYSWDSENNKWVNREKEEWTYNEKGNKTLYVSYSWDRENNKWMNRAKEEWTYNEKGDETLYVSYSWDSENNKWMNRAKEEWTYNEKGNNTLYVSYSWDSDNNKWVNSRKEEKIYDVNGYIRCKRSYYWNSATQSWSIGEQQEIYCDAKGNENLVITERDGKESKTINVYDEGGSLIQLNYYSWNKENEEWYISSKAIFTYNYSFSGDVVYHYTLDLWLFFEYISHNAFWKIIDNIDRGVDVYDDDDCIYYYDIYRAGGRTFVDYIVNMSFLSSSKIYDLNKETNELELSEALVYKVIDVGNESKTTPVRNIEVEDAEVVAVYNLSGQKVSSNIDSLTQGVYIVVYSNGASKKILVK